MYPLVSVIIPVYNRAVKVQRAIQSALAQTYAELEIIVVDDGSTDQTYQVVDAFQDARIKLVRQVHNLGAAAARNTGMRTASGKFIAWLDSDDEWKPEKLELQLAALSLASPIVKACYCAQERIESGDVRIHIPQNINQKQLFFGCDIGPGTTLVFEKSILDHIGYLDESMPRYEDWDWLIRYCSKYELMGMPKALARVYYTPHASAEIVERSARIWVSKHNSLLSTFGSKFRRQVVSRRWMEVASYYAMEHKIFRVLQFCFQALRIFPLQPVHVWAWLINSWFGVKIGKVLRVNVQ